MRVILILSGAVAVFYLAICGWLYANQDALLFFPTHFSAETDLHPWIVNDEIIGYCREVPRPAAVWLMTHGNGGQADQRSYVLRRMSVHDSFYVLEYPGYGSRSGQPSAPAINRAASEAFQILKKKYPSVPLCVLGESMGSGPASFLAASKVPPDKIVLIVPFDILSSVAARQYPYFPVRRLMTNDWDNGQLLKNYRGPVEIVGAIEDGVIPIEHARNLAAQVPSAKFQAIAGGHGWADSPSEIRLTP